MLHALVLYVQLEQLESYTLAVSLSVSAIHYCLKKQHSKPNMSQLVLLSYCSLLLSSCVSMVHQCAGRLVDELLNE